MRSAGAVTRSPSRLRRRLRPRRGRVLRMPCASLRPPRFAHFVKCLIFVSLAATVTASRSASELPAFFDELAAWADRTWPALTTTSYGEDAAQVLDLRLPVGDGPHPVAFVLHGGFWRAPFTRRNTAAVCAALTK